MTPSLNRIPSLTNDLQEHLRLFQYSEAIKLTISIYELAFKQLYRSHLGSLKRPWRYYDQLKNAGIEDIEKCFFGKWLGFLAKTDFLEEVHLIIRDHPYKKKSELLNHLNEINDLRIEETHYRSTNVNTPPLTKEIARYAENRLMVFLRQFKLSKDQELTELKQYNSVNVQKLHGEVQLYESLYHTLCNSRVTNLDVTYFSNKVPEPNDDAAIQKYWSHTRDLTEKGHLKMRRIISIDEEDEKGIKLLWLLFNMVPKCYHQLGDKLRLSILRTSNRITLKEHPGVPVDLFNMILMYDRKTPDYGHVWIFTGHQSGDHEQEYIHIFGSKLILFQKIYTQLFNSSMELGKQTIRTILTERKGDLDSQSIQSFIDNVMGLKKQLKLADEDKDQICEVYDQIFGEKGLVDDIW